MSAITVLLGFGYVYGALETLTFLYCVFAFKISPRDAGERGGLFPVAFSLCLVWPVVWIMVALCLVLWIFYTKALDGWVSSLENRYADW